MDALSSAMVAAAPQLGIGGILFALLVYVLRNAATDRGDYRTALTAAQQRHDTELSRIKAAYADELAALRADLAELRKRVDELNAALDAERTARHRAEDKAAEALRRAGGQS